MMIRFSILSQSNRVRLFFYVEIILLVFALIGWAFMVMGLVLHHQLNFDRIIAYDFDVFYHSNRHFLLHHDLYAYRQYTDFVSFTTGVISRYIIKDLSSPFFHLIFMPIGMLPSSWAYITMVFLNLFLLIYNIRFLIQKHFRYWIVILIFYTPIMSNIVLGQVGLLLWSLVTALYRHLHQPRISGILFGILLSLKYFFGLWLIVWIIHRRWISIGYSLTTFLACSALSWIYFGPETIVNHIMNLSSIQWFDMNWNASIMGICTRFYIAYQSYWVSFQELAQAMKSFHIFGGSVEPSYQSYGDIYRLIPRPYYQRGLFSWGIAFLHLGFLMFYIWIVYRSRFLIQYDDLKNNAYQNGKTPPSYAFMLLLGITCAFAILLSPLGWIYYFPLIAFAIYALWMQSSSLTEDVMISFCVLLCGMIRSLETLQSSSSIWLFYYDSLSCLGLLSIIGLSTYRLFHPKPPILKKKWISYMILSLSFFLYSFIYHVEYTKNLMSFCRIFPLIISA